MGPESRFIKSINSKLPKEVYYMKNHNMYIGGVPDCWYSGPGGDLWAEFKYANGKLSALQQDWITKRRAEGRRVWIITGNKQGGMIDGAQYTKAEIVKLIAEVTIGKKTKGNSRRK